ncbi:hypothetical protein WN55_06715 [Dufourea novaeangliae]|uniref:Uncharacterized protein n=1 Tax=Dufourea novaeangliae TaxID=178035 RepID=A0A154PQP5_DUFNO|nr:hypothetical protein WN55_06715 [Dufourea novaeangliae]
MLSKGTATKETGMLDGRFMETVLLDINRPTDTQFTAVRKSSNTIQSTPGWI